MNEKQAERRKLAINTLSAFCAIGFGLGLYEGKALPFFLAMGAYAIAWYIAKERRND